MCLGILDKEIKVLNTDIAYKVVDKDYHPIYGVVYASNIFSYQKKCGESIELLIGKQYKDKYKYNIKVHRLAHYKNGFHCLLNLKDAIIWGTHHSCGLYKILKVRFEDVTATGYDSCSSERPVVVARTISILEEIPYEDYTKRVEE